MLRVSVAILFWVGAAFAQAPAWAQKQYDPGATDTEIKVGNIMPYTGVFSEYGVIGRAEAAYFKMVNDQGGVNGRKINFVTLDDGSSVDKTAELARKLVEEEQVLLTVGIWGSRFNLAIRAYMNEQKVPQLFVDTTSAVLDDPAHFPWTMGFQAPARTEGLAYARYVLRNKPQARIAVLYASNDEGREWVAGVHDGLGDRASTMIVKEASFAYSDPATIDAQIVALKNSGADVFMNFTVGRFATQAIRRAYDVDWHPLQFLPNASLSIAAFLDPAGLEKAVGIISNARSKGWSSPEERRDPAVHDFLDWMRKYNPGASERDANNVYGYEIAQTLVEVLKKCGDELTRDNVMKQATSLDLELGMLRPGIRVSTSPTDYQPIKQLYLIRFSGKDWTPIVDITGG
jgi:branched-chain amino acid transport system substrate-binding protein